MTEFDAPGARAAQLLAEMRASANESSALLDHLDGRRASGLLACLALARVMSDYLFDLFDPDDMATADWGRTVDQLILAMVDEVGMTPGSRLAIEAKHWLDRGGRPRPGPS